MKGFELTYTSVDCCQLHWPFGTQLVCESMDGDCELTSR